MYFPLTFPSEAFLKFIKIIFDFGNQKSKDVHVVMEDQFIFEGERVGQIPLLPIPPRPTPHKKVHNTKKTKENLATYQKNFIQGFWYQENSDRKTTNP